jgi:hypothetical protein
MIVVHRYKILDPATGDRVVQLAKRSEEQIKALGGQIIAGTSEAVEPAMLDDAGRYNPTAR